MVRPSQPFRVDAKNVSYESVSCLYLHRLLKLCRELFTQRMDDNSVLGKHISVGLPGCFVLLNTTIRSLLCNKFVERSFPN